MAEAYKGYSLNEHLEANWFNRENTLFKAIIDRLPNSGTTLVTTQHVHSKLVSSDAAIDPSIACDANGRLIVGNGLAAGDTLLHVWAASAGAVTAMVGSLVTLENNTSVFLQFLSPNTNANAIYFGDVDDADVGGITYSHGSHNMSFYAETIRAILLDVNGYTLINPAGTHSVADCPLHVAVGSAGAVTALAGTAVLIEGSAVKYLSFLSPSGAGGTESGLVWGDEGDNDEAGVRYHNGTLRLNFYVDSALRLYIGNAAVVLSAGEDLYTTAWTTFAPGTISGWAGGYTSEFYWKRIGNLAFVQYKITGTGDLNVTYFSLPAAASLDCLVVRGAAGTGTTDDPTQMTYVETATDTAFVTNVGPGGGATAWGNGVTKWVCGQFWFQVG